VDLRLRSVSLAQEIPIFQYRWSVAVAVEDHRDASETRTKVKGVATRPWPTVSDSEQRSSSNGWSHLAYFGSGESASTEDNAGVGIVCNETIKPITILWNSYKVRKKIHVCYKSDTTAALYSPCPVCQALCTSRWTWRVALCCWRALLQVDSVDFPLIKPWKKTRDFQPPCLIRGKPWETNGKWCPNFRDPSRGSIESCPMRSNEGTSTSTHECIRTIRRSWRCNLT